MKIITTVGTSLVANWGETYDKQLEKGAFSEALFDGQRDSALKKAILNLKDILVQYANENGGKASAEITSIEKIPNSKDAELYLICTETILSRICGEVLKSHFGSRVKKLMAIQGLRIDDSGIFESVGIQNLIHEITAIGNEAGWKDCCLNISGGYKALIPFTTIIGQLYKIPLHYVYEDSEELITISQQVMGADWSLVEQYSTFLASPHLAGGGNLSSMRELGLMQNDKNELTILGKILAEFIAKNDHPFASSTVGYMVEYKLWEYLIRHPPNGVSEVIHALKSSTPENGHELDDIDIWMKTSNASGIAVEIKSIEKKSKEIRKAIERHLTITKSISFKIDAFWVVLYSFEERNDDILKKMHDDLNNGCFSFPVAIKFIQLQRNSVDGSRNRFSQHEFWRSEITQLHHFQPTIKSE
jgi:CRISPR/Cas system-associated protein Csm6